MRLPKLLVVVPALVVLTALTGFTPQRLPSWKLSNTGVTARLRGLSVLSGRVAWASGSAGTVLRTTDGGRTWRQVGPAGTADLQFRDVEAFGTDRAVVLSIGEGEQSRVYATDNGGQTWTETFRNSDPSAFYDCMAFFDRHRGLALSDPVDGHFRIASTSDGGRSWRVLPTSGMPAALSGEFAFAASGTCLVTADRFASADRFAAGDGAAVDQVAAGRAAAGRAAADRVAGGAVGAGLQDAQGVEGTDRGSGRAWFATGGGSSARVFSTDDRGLSWTVADTPVPSGPSAGIYSLAFRDARHGIAVGGDFTTPTSAPHAAAVTRNGGQTWVSATAEPGEYRSGVTWVPRPGQVALAVGPTGSDISYDGGLKWTRFDSGSFDAVDCASDGVCWASGEQGRIAKLRVR